jgi:hypothetical protein
MTKEKQLYVSPETEALVIQIEGVICGSNDFNDPSDYSIGGNPFAGA